MSILTIHLMFGRMIFRKFGPKPHWGSNFRSFGKDYPAKLGVHYIRPHDAQLRRVIGQVKFRIRIPLWFYILFIQWPLGPVVPPQPIDEPPTTSLLADWRPRPPRPRSCHPRHPPQLSTRHWLEVVTSLVRGWQIGSAAPGKPLQLLGSLT